MSQSWSQLSPSDQQRIENVQRETLFYKYKIIRESVSAIDVGRVLGLDIDSKGRCRCPFHNGTDRNMKVYDGSRGYYCFVCHEHGDNISLAKKLISSECKYHEAAKWIDDTFHLNVFHSDRMTPWQRVRRAEMRAAAKRNGGTGK